MDARDELRAASLAVLFFLLQIEQS